MALPITRWGSVKRSAGIYSAIYKQIKVADYGGAKKITFSFDPFGEELGVQNTRYALGYLNQQRVRATNLNCSLKTNVLSDRSDPSIHVLLVDGSEVIIKTQRLNPLEILQQFNNFVSVKAPKKEVSTKTEVKTKAQKAALRRK